MKTLVMASMIAAATVLGGCEFQKSDESANADSAAQPVTPQPAPAPMAAVDTTGLRFVVDISDRMLYVMRGADSVQTTPVAVGMADHPTPTGDYKIHRVDWNPDWTPPPGEDWTEDKEPEDPGSPKNPMGRARLVFQPPYTIHGTKDNASLGKAESHGSIRVDNDAVVKLGKMVMEAGGASKPESFFQDVAANRKTMKQIDIPNPIPLTIRE